MTPIHLLCATEPSSCSALHLGTLALSGARFEAEPALLSLAAAQEPDGLWPREPLYLTPGTDELIGRVMSDAEFRTKLLEKPEETLRAEGYDASPETIEAIRGVSSADIDALARDFERVSSARKAAS